MVIYPNVCTFAYIISTNIQKFAQMYIKKQLIIRIIEDVKFRERLASALGVKNRAVYNQALRYRDNPTPNSNFTKIVAIEFFKSEGYTDDQILTEDISAE